MNRVQQLREVIKKLIPMLVARSIVVTQVGGQAFVATDKKTLKPVRVNIPHLPDDADERLCLAIQGFIDHELGHVFDTDWAAVAECEKRGATPDRVRRSKLTPKQAGAFMSQVHNVVEDPYVERKMGERFRGSTYNIDKLHDIFIEKISKPAIENAKTAQDRFGCIFVPLVRAWAGQKKFAEFLVDNGYDKEPLVEAFTKLVPDSVKQRIAKTQTSWECLEIAEILFDIMHPEPPPPPPALPQQSMADAINEEMKDQGEQKSDEQSDSEKSDDPDGEGNNQDKPEDEDDKGTDGDKSDEQQPADQAGDEGDAEAGDEPADEGDQGEGKDDGEEGKEAEAGSEDQEEADGADESDAEVDEEGNDGSDADNDEDVDGEGDGEGGSDAGDEENDGEENGDSGKGAGGSKGSEADDQDEDDEAGDDNAAGDDEGDEEDDDAEGDEAGDEGDAGGGKADDKESDGSGDQADDADDEDGDKASADGDGDRDNDTDGDEDDADGEVGSEGDDEDGESRSTGEKADAEDEAETGRHQTEEAPESSPFQGLEMENLGDDLSKGVAFLITNEATRAIKGLDYRVYTTEWDVCEKFPVAAGNPTVQVYDNKNGRWGTRDITINNMVEELDERTSHMVAPMQKDIERMMAARSQVLKVPGYRSGRLHSGSLHRLRTGDDRVFRRLEEHKSQETAVTLLIDNSGSMSGEKIKMAMSAGYALSSTLQRVNIKHEVIGFTTMEPRGVKDYVEQQEKEEERIGRGFSRYGALYHPLFKDFNERLSPEVKRRFATAPYTLRMGGNTDGEAVRFAGNRLALRAEPRKVLIVLSDGHPAGMSRFPDEIYSDLHKAVEECEKKKIETIGVGIMDNAVKDFYPKHIVLKDLAELPKQVMKELKGILLQ
jgi:cobalamin biosynthesis protein CobT